MRKVASGALFTGLATAMVFAGAGVAAAAPAQSGTPTDDYQVCGAVYEDAPWIDSGAAPEDAEGIGGVDVTGTLYDSSDQVVIIDGQPAVYSTTTASDGSFCIQGSSDMVDYVVTQGAYVKIANDIPGSTTHKWETNGIYSSDFASHVYISVIPFITQSAWQFYMVG